MTKNDEVLLAVLTKNDYNVDATVEWINQFHLSLGMTPFEAQELGRDSEVLALVV
jgi:uncharacterized protein YgfB (UPF0149 family)